MAKPEGAESRSGCRRLLEFCACLHAGLVQTVPAAVLLFLRTPEAVLGDALEFLF